MASSSSLTWRYRVFMSFRVPDVRKTFLSHLRKQFSRCGITMSPVPTQGIKESIICIRESRISIIVLSKNFASSAWCLDELLEILKCKEEMGQIVMTIFYGVDPSDVQKQTGYFGRTFEQFCAGITEMKVEKERGWSQALAKVGIIAGEESRHWDNEAEMIEKVAKDVLDKLNATPSKDFDGMVGLEAHLKEMESLLDLDSDGVKMVGIYGPSGIGKTTIARALHSLFSSRFQLTCFVDNLMENYHSGFDDYGVKLRLQEQFLSKVLNHNGMRISHLGAVKENLCDQKVLIILDDVNALNQLEALANENTWFGPGSRIVVTTKHQELLQQHGINIDNVYTVGSPSREEALEILCKYAFRQSYPHNGFKELAERVVDLCGNLSLGLRVVGSSLRGKNKEEWVKSMRRLETIDIRDIEQVQRAINELAPSNRPAGKSKSLYSTGMAFLVVINLLMEITSAVSDQLFSIRKPYFARISLLLSFLSVVLSILDIRYKIRASKARFRCKWPIPWFYYNGGNTIFGRFTDTVVLFCAVGQLIVSTINFSFIERSRDGPIKVSVWPLFFAIGMVISKFMENPANSMDILPISKKKQ